MEDRPAEILIVDDTPENIRLVSTVLEDYNTSFAKSGEDALSLIQEERYDLILLDVMMPGIDGYTTCKRLREIPGYSHTPIIFLTAKHDNEAIIKGFKSGGQDYLSKPFNTEELRARVKTQLGYRQYQEQLEHQITMQKEQNRAKDLILLQQSKMVQMGESFSMMAHQWRQPLTSISAATMSLEVNLTMDNYDKQKFHETLHIINENTQHLNRTIDEYKNFFKPKSTFEPITFQDLMDKTLLLNQHILKQGNITVNLHVQSGKTRFNTLINELIQVFLVIMQNSTDACIENQSEGKIDIFMESTPTHTDIIFEDNGGGVPEDSMQNIFDLYYTTKGKNGSGIGLYMVKKIVEEHLHGTIDISNTGNGVRCHLSLPDTV